MSWVCEPLWVGATGACGHGCGLRLCNPGPTRTRDMGLTGITEVSQVINWLCVKQLCEQNCSFKTYRKIIDGDDAINAPFGHDNERWRLFRQRGCGSMASKLGVYATSHSILLRWHPF